MEKMSKALLTSKTAWSSRLCALTWKEKVTKSGRSIFQLQVSKLPTEEKESGLWLTPSASMRENRSEEAMKHRVEYRKSIGRTTVPPGNLAEQVQYGEPTTDMKIWRTPDAHCDRGASSKERMEMKLEKGMPISLNDQVAHPNLMWPTPRASKAMSEDVSNIKERGVDKGRLEERVAQMLPTPSARDYKGGSGTIKEKDGKYYRQSNTTGEKYGVRLDALVEYQDRQMWPTPNASDNRDRGNMSDPSIQRRIRLGKHVGLTMAVKEKKGGGSLNPTWVEWLMGYPEGYTDLKDWAILSSRKSSKK